MVYATNRHLYLLGVMPELTDHVYFTKKLHFVETRLLLDTLKIEKKGQRYCLRYIKLLLITKRKQIMHIKSFIISFSSPTRISLLAKELLFFLYYT